MENLQYKHDDYSIRSRDVYALTKYKIILAWLPQKANLQVLNAGCGSGEMSVLLAQNRTWHIDAIDFDSEAVRLSKSLVNEQGLHNVSVFQGAIETFSGRNYDIVISNDVLEHIADDSAAIASLSQMLKPDGILCVSVPALQWLFGYHDELLGHYRRYNKHVLQARLRPYFDVKSCRYFGGTLIPLAILYSRLWRRSYPVGQQRPNSVVAKALDLLLATEQRITLPIGTSILAWATTLNR